MYWIIGIIVVVVIVLLIVSKKKSPKTDAINAEESKPEVPGENKPTE
ncbi:MAG: hypothetical protein V1686_02055 [Patescibacteria group bacterium]